MDYELLLLWPNMESEEIGLYEPAAKSVCGHPTSPITSLLRERVIPAKIPVLTSHRDTAGSDVLKLLSAPEEQSKYPVSYLASCYEDVRRCGTGSNIFCRSLTCYRLIELPCDV
jgi:hypothetical protein